MTGSLHAKALGLLVGRSGDLPEEIVPSVLLEGNSASLVLGRRMVKDAVQEDWKPAFPASFQFEALR